MNKSAIGIVGGLVGAIITAVIVVPADAPITETKYENTGATKGGEVITKVTAPMCFPFVYEGTSTEMKEYVNKIQTRLDTEVNMLDLERDRLERLKARFISDANYIDAK